MPVALQKPRWLDKKINLFECARIKAVLVDSCLNTVCQEATCPNIGECFARGEATFLILGKICTRDCSFCGVSKNLPPQAVDPGEPERIAQTVKKLALGHIVVTSVTRDDLADGGSGHFAKTISAIRNNCPGVNIEVLIPDFNANESSLNIVVKERPKIIAHNLETVPRLYRVARQKADYNRSLNVLDFIKKQDKHIFTKSGLMLGLGETHQEVLEVLRDLRRVGCDFLSLGQYLSPSLKHLPVEEYIRPEEFAHYRQEAQGLGFSCVLSGPYVRSSYLASDYLKHATFNL